MTLKIIKYGIGNIYSIQNIYKSLDIEVEFASTKEELKKSTKLILPGVGSFDWAMNLINNSGMRETLDDLVINKEIPILGICVGFQMLAKKSEEGSELGFGWIDANVEKFNFKNDTNSQAKNSLKLPHLGWNNISLVKNSLLTDGIKNNFFYFLHSYFLRPENEEITLAKTNYINEFTSIIQKNNIFGVQFHPEKSHLQGTKLLQNFALKIYA